MEFRHGRTCNQAIAIAEVLDNDLEAKNEFVRVPAEGFAWIHTTVTAASTLMLPNEVK
jgi:hypothetical protein